MKRTVFGVLLGVVLAVVVALAGQYREALAQRVTPSATGSTGELIVVPAPAGERGQLLTVIDQRGRAMSVYFVEAATGKISLRSVRNIQYDLQMTDFNGESPLPREIRLQLEQR
jgi:hypothetical protein